MRYLKSSNIKNSWQPLRRGTAAPPHPIPVPLSCSPCVISTRLVSFWPVPFPRIILTHISLSCIKSYIKTCIASCSASYSVMCRTRYSYRCMYTWQQAVVIAIGQTVSPAIPLTSLESTRPPIKMTPNTRMQSIDFHLFRSSGMTSETRAKGVK